MGAKGEEGVTGEIPVALGAITSGGRSDGAPAACRRRAAPKGATTSAGARGSERCSLAEEHFPGCTWEEPPLGEGPRGLGTSPGDMKQIFHLHALLQEGTSPCRSA